MLQNSTFEILASCVTALVAVTTLFWSVNTQNKMRKDEVKRAIIEAFNRLQSEVLDKLVLVDKVNAKVIADAREDNEAYRQAYNDYKTLIARLEHFAVGVEKGAYDLDVVDRLAGDHLIYLYPKVEPIIAATNDQVQTEKYYQSYSKLVKKLEQRHRES